MAKQINEGWDGTVPRDAKVEFKTMTAMQSERLSDDINAMFRDPPHHCHISVEDHADDPPLTAEQQRLKDERAWDEVMATYKANFIPPALFDDEQPEPMRYTLTRKFIHGMAIGAGAALGWLIVSSVLVL